MRNAQSPLSPESSSAGFIDLDTGSAPLGEEDESDLDAEEAQDNHSTSDAEGPDSDLEIIGSQPRAQENRSSSVEYMEQQQLTRWVQPVLLQFQRSRSSRPLSHQSHQGSHGRQNSHRHQSHQSQGTEISKSNGSKLPKIRTSLTENPGSFQKR